VPVGIDPWVYPVYAVLFGRSSGGKTLFARIAGAFDQAPTDLVPPYELWVGRREGWLKVAPPTKEFPGDRTVVA
jgi:hypothetical protein